MAYNQPFYTFPNGYQPNGYGNAYVAPQMPNTYYGAQPQMQMQQSAQNQPFNGFQQQQGQMGQPQPIQGAQGGSNGSQQGFPIKDIRFVTSDEAKAFIVMPNSNALLLDTVNGMAYLKSADGVGQSVTECYKFTKVAPDGTIAKRVETFAEKKSDIDLSQFIKITDIPALIGQYGFVTVEQYKSLKEELDSLKAQIKGNSGGLSNGRKQREE